MKKRLTSIAIVFSLTASLLSLGGCTKESSTSTSIGAGSISESASSSIAQSLDGQSGNDEASAIPAELNNTYTTRFGEVNPLTYPPFAFDYPDGWTITREEVTLESEFVTLTSDSGATIRFSYIGQRDPGGGSAVSMRKVEVTKVADAGFSPWYVQAADYTDMGPFMVAELKTVGILDMQTDTEYTPIDGWVSYAVLPESFIGTHSGLRSDDIIDFAFWYSGNVAFIASGDFSEQEKQEAIAILASFRDVDASPDTTGMGGQTAASIDELWTMLDGTWELEEFRFHEKVQDYSEHTVEFCHVDNKACMRKEFRGKDSYVSDVFFYDIASTNAIFYDVYTYIRGSFGGEGANWSSDVRAVWWSFDLSNLANGEIVLTYIIATDNGFIDDANVFKYRRV